MSRIFLSHSSADSRAALALKHWLGEVRPQLANEIFLDIDPASGMQVGERWKGQLFKHNSRCEAVICLLSHSWQASHECEAEYRIAESLGKQILVARLENLDDTDITSEWQHCDLFAADAQTAIEVPGGPPARFSTAALNQLRKAIEGTGVGPENFVWPPKEDPHRAPYRGWEPFEDIDAAVFFGRDAPIVRGLDELRTMRLSGVKSLFVVLGQSGSGKSSFLRAGLIPRLQRDDRHFLTLGVMRPERSALTGDRGLAAAIRTARHALHLPGATSGEIKNACLNDSARVAELLIEVRGAATKRLADAGQDGAAPTLVLPLDQAEELFSNDAGPQADQFLLLVAELIGKMNTDEVGLIVAATIRTDRYEAMQRHPAVDGIGTLLFDEFKPMPPTQFEKVITGPAARASEGGQTLTMAPDLVTRLLEDAAGGADTLPLLSLTLARLCTDWTDEADASGGQLTLADYESMGGMRDVVNNEIEQVLLARPGDRQHKLELLRAAFIPELVTINPDNDQPMRRMAGYDDLPAESQPLIDDLVAKRLMVKDTRSGHVVVEVALESLLRQWDDLAGWLSEERQNLLNAEDLQRNTNAWEKRGRDPDWLLPGTRLADAERLAKKPEFAHRLANTAQYLAASRGAENRRVSTVRRRKRVVRGAVAIATVVAVVAGFVVFEWARAAIAGRLVQEAEQMLQGGRAGGDVRALQQLLAANKLGAAPASTVANSLRDQLKILDASPPGGPVTAVRSVAASRDGRYIASGGDDHRVVLFDAKTGRQRSQLVDKGADPNAHEAKVWSVAFSPDGHRLATAGDDQIVHLWDVDSGQARGNPLTGHKGSVLSVAFSPDGHRLASAGVDHTVRLWNADTGQPLATRTEHAGAVRSVAFSPDGGLIASASDDHTVRLWDGNDGHPIARSEEMGAQALCVAFGPRGDKIAAGMLDGAIEVWDERTLRPPAEAVTPGIDNSKPVNGIAFSPDGARIVAGSGDSTVRVWDWRAHTLVGHPLAGHHGQVWSVNFSGDGTRILSGGGDGSVRIWDAIIGLPIPAGQGDIRAAAFSPNGSQIASGGHDGTVKIWNAYTGSLIGAPLGDRSDDYSHVITSVAFSADGTQVVAGGNDGSQGGRVVVWDLTTRRAVNLPVDPVQPQAEDARIKSVAVSPNGSLIVSGGNDGAVRLWNAHTYQPIATMRPPQPYQIWSVAVSPDSRQIVSASGEDDNSVELWDVNPPGLRGPAMVGRPGFPLYSVSFSPDGQSIISASNDGTIRVWSVPTREPVAVMSGDQNPVLSVAFAHTHPWIVSGDTGGTVRFWDVMTHQPIGVPPRGDHNWVSSVAFNADDTRVLSGSWDGNLQLHLPPTDVTEALCAKLGSNMSHVQWREWVSPWIPYLKTCPNLPVP
jgi:WD40 repeat protein